MWQDEFIELLWEEFRATKEKNPRFSIRAYAKKIGLSAGSLSDTLQRKKKWRVSAERAAQILERLSLSSTKKNRLRLKMGVSPSVPRAPLDRDDFEILRNWVSFPILFAHDLPESFATAKNIADRLGLSEEKVRSVIDDLLRRNLLQRLPDGRLSRSDGTVTAGDGPPDEVVRGHHASNLKIAARALTKLPMPRRDFTSMTFAGSERQMDAVREEIRRFHERISALMDEGEENTQVFRLSVQLFPLDFK